MESKQKYEIASTIWLQLSGYTPHYILWSWGLRDLRAVELNRQAGLAFDVNGFLFSGTVIIKLDEGADLYDVCLEKDGTISVAKEGVFYDELGNIIDSLVEKKPETSAEEYAKQISSKYSLA